jgi:hypothetical protein
MYKFFKGFVITIMLTLTVGEMGLITYALIYHPHVFFVHAPTVSNHCPK